MNALDEKLAEIAGNYPALWNRHSNDFKNNIKRENNIKHIAEILGCSADTVITRFKALREKYRKEKKKISDATRSGAGTLNFEPWYLMKSLAFLDTVQVARKLSGNQESQTHSTDSSKTNDSSVIDWLDNLEVDNDGDIPELSTANTRMKVTQKERKSFTSSPRPDTSKTPEHVELPYAGRKRKPSTPQWELEGYINRLANAAEATVASGSAAPEETSECSIYGKYVGEALKKLPEELAGDAMLEISKILHHYRKKT